MLGSSACETWNTGCGCGAGWTLPEQQAWVNVNAFAARLMLGLLLTVAAVWVQITGRPCTSSSTTTKSHRAP
ncbi:hypothetical protein DL765_003737 [Monosporascus sp. GIB2]|nr:hypothetical protein DL765_003737 [Monosporascus sp. GIB2]